MLAIRLARVGAKKQAAYRVVVMEKSRPRNSRSVEIVGHYNPRRNPTELLLHQERIQYWLSKGAQPSDRVRLLIEHYDPEKAAAAAKTAAGQAAGSAAGTAGSEGSGSTA
jgi:small subunit ribosomal protein S16